MYIVNVSSLPFGGVTPGEGLMGTLGAVFETCLWSLLTCLLSLLFKLDFLTTSKCMEL